MTTQYIMMPTQEYIQSCNYCTLWIHLLPIAEIIFNGVAEFNHGTRSWDINHYHHRKIHSIVFIHPSIRDQHIHECRVMKSTTTTILKLSYATGGEFTLLNLISLTASEGLKVFTVQTVRNLTEFNVLEDADSRRWRSLINFIPTVQTFIVPLHIAL